MLHQKCRKLYGSLARTDEGHIVAAQNDRTNGKGAEPMLVSEIETVLVPVNMLHDVFDECGKGGKGIVTDATRTSDVCGQCFAALKFSPHVVAVDMHDGNIILRRFLSKAGELDGEVIASDKLFLLFGCESGHEFVHECLLHIRLSTSRRECGMQFGGDFPRAEATVHPCVCRLPGLAARKGQPGVGYVDCRKYGVLPLLESVEERVQPLRSNVASVRREFECAGRRTGMKPGCMDQELFRERSDDGGQDVVVHMLRKEKQCLAAADVAHTRRCRHGRPIGVLRPLPRHVIQCIRP